MSSTSHNTDKEKDTGYSKSGAPSISMPKGGGAMKGIDEKFSVNAVNGTSGMSIPLPSLKTRSDFAPSLTLSYNSGSGNSEFGLGWGLSLPSIQRKTDRRLPLYNDVAESDIFLFAGAEDLVPVIGDAGNPNPIIIAGANGFTITKYIPRVEGLFARIEKIQPNGQSYFYWRVTTKENTNTYFGLHASSRLSNPQFPSFIYKWLPDFSIDDKGNYHVFEYKQEDLINVPKNVHEAHRHNGLQPIVNIYLKRIQYGNHSAFYLSDTNPYNPILPSNPYFFYTTVFDYGEHDLLNPTIAEANAWAFRKDAFSDYHAGFDIRTYRLCKRVLCFSTFEELNPDLPTNLKRTPHLIQSIDFSYKYESATNELLETDYIIEATHWMYRKNTTNYDKKKLPPMKFSYNEVVWNTSIQAITKDNLEHSTVGLSSGYQWTDFYGEGISGILTEQTDAWYYKSNLGNGTFTPAQKIAPKPNFSGLQWQDLNGDGKRHAVSNNKGTQGYFELDDDDKWQNFRPFTNVTNIDFNDPNTRMLDLNGDGKPDILISQERVFVYYESKGTDGYEAPKTAPHPLDENKGASIVFADSTQSIFLADMSGDGMTDIVRIRNKEVCYWANLGYGRFGAKIVMSNAPLMDNPELFNPSYIHLSDISGTGASDIIYLGKNKFRAWLNLSGNGWSEVQEINPFPNAELPNTLSVVDLLGHGTSCLVWSSPLPQYSNTPMRYIDLMGGNKPYLMRAYDNSAGKQISLTYKSSTHYYLEDKLNGTPWITKLPFPVHCVQTSEIKDLVTGNIYSNTYSYHHGYYDHEEREFRGFGRVETKDTESFINPNEQGTLDEPPTLTKSWYHTGAWIRDTKILNHFKHEYFQPQLIGSFTEHDLVQPFLPTTWTAIEQREAFRAMKGVLLRQEVYALDNSEKQAIPYSASEHNYDIQLVQAKSNHRFAVFLVHEKESIAYNYERVADDPRIAHSINLAIDKYANVLESASVVYVRVNPPVTGIPQVVSDAQNKTHIIYTTINYTNDVIDSSGFNYRLRIPWQTKQFELTGNIAPTGAVIVGTKNYYLPNDLLNGFATATEIDYSASPDIAGVLKQKRCIEAQKARFYRDDANTIITADGQMESKAIAYQSYRLAFTEDLLTQAYGIKVNAPQMLVTEGHYVSENYKLNGVEKTYYWIPSGSMIYSTTPASEFYLPHIYADPWNHQTTVHYYSNYFLFIERTIDTLGNYSKVLAWEWRTLQPQKIEDTNANHSIMAYDILGMPTGMALLGKGNDETDTEADSLLGFSADLTPSELTDFFADPVSNAPAMLKDATARYIYDYENLPLRVATIAREIHYKDTINNGTPSPLQLAFEYSDGLGRLLMKKVQAEPEIGSTTLRWVGSGRTILNNKSKPIKQYEPYFSNTHECETDVDIIQVGFSPVIYYDPVGRAIKTEMPDGTYSNVVFDAWMQTSYDANDNVIGSPWEAIMSSGTAEEQDAYNKTLIHANTPTVVHTDSLARPFYTIQIIDPSIGGAGEAQSYVALDIEGNSKEIHDARGLTQLTYKHDILGNIIYQNSIDGNARWMLNDVFGKPMYGWDSMNQIAHNIYDSLHRPLEGYIDDRLISKVEYGELEPNAQQQNFRGQALRTWDSSGKHELITIDFKGQPLKSSVTLIANAKIIDVNWNDTATVPAVILGNEVFITEIVYDALGRPIQQIAPSGNTTENKYGEGGLLKTVLLDGAPYVQDIHHNAKGQRETIWYGNNTKTSYEYIPQNYRLKRQLTVNLDTNEILQDLRYTYDAVGNITTLYNNALEKVYFNNQEVEPKQSYTYDALYRLIEARGRETINQNQDNDTINEFTPYQVNFGNHNVNALTNYTQQYTYDAVGNILKLKHIAGIGSYTRDYVYDNTSNLLQSTSIDAFTYSYDAHGNMRNMPHLQVMTWNALDQLSIVSQDNQNFAYYQYSGGNRIRKTVEKQDGTTEQRIYLGNYEIYRTYDTNSLQPILERNTLHIADDTGRIAMQENLLLGNDGSADTLLRYIHSNHLQSATLELDQNGDIITYEEYHPYGTTSYSAKSASINAVSKRYRFTGKERDEESGLYYHGARYYIPWLARWSAIDPLESKYAGLSSYNYCLNNPLKFIDSEGRDVDVAIKDNTITISSTIFVYGENSEQLAVDFQNDFNDFSSKALQGRTYKELDKDGKLIKEWNIEIKMKFVSAKGEDKIRIENATNESKGENLIIIKNETGRAEAGHHGEKNTDYKATSSKLTTSSDFPNKKFPRSTGGISTGNIAWLYIGDGGKTAVHEIFHLFGLGDRYSDASYQKVFKDGKIGYTKGESIGHIGWENDIMSKGLKTLFSQIHIDNLAKIAMETSLEKEADIFSMSRKADTSDNKDMSVIPQTLPIKWLGVKTEIIGEMINPIYTKSGENDQREK